MRRSIRTAGTYTRRDETPRTEHALIWKQATLALIFVFIAVTLALLTVFFGVYAILSPEPRLSAGWVAVWFVPEVYFPRKWLLVVDGLVTLWVWVAVFVPLVIQRLRTEVTDPGWSAAAITQRLAAWGPWSGWGFQHDPHEPQHQVIDEDVGPPVPTGAPYNARRIPMTTNGKPGDPAYGHYQSLQQYATIEQLRRMAYHMLSDNPPRLSRGVWTRGELRTFTRPQWDALMEHFEHREWAEMASQTERRLTMLGRHMLSEFYPHPDEDV